MSELATTADIVRHFVLEQFLAGEDPSLLHSDTELVTGGILDSLGTLKLVTFLEEEFGVIIPPARTNATELNTIESIASLVESLR